MEEWMNESKIERKNGCLNERLRERMDEWLKIGKKG
jgi:hypothetical protein